MRRLALGVLACFATATLVGPAAAQDQISAFDDLLGRPRQAEPPAPESPAPKAPRPQTAPDDPAPEQAADELQARRAAIAERLRVAQRAVQAADGATGPELSGEIERLKRQKTLLGQQQAAAARNAELAAAKAKLTAELAAFAEQGFGAAPPYSFALLDQLRDEAQTLRQRAENALAAVQSAADALAGAKESAEAAGRKRRQTAEAHRDHTAPEGPAPPPLKLAELDAQIALDQVALRKAELAGERLNAEVIELAIELADKKIEYVAPRVTLTDEVQREILAALDKEEGDLEFACSKAEQRLQYLADRVDEAESAARLAGEPGSLELADLEARRLARNAQQQYFNLLNKQLARVSDRRAAWKRRFEVVRGSAGRAQLSQWADEAAQAVEQLSRERRLQVRELADVRKQLGDVERRLQSLGPEDIEPARFLSERRRIYQELIDRYGENLTSQERARRLQERLLADVSDNHLTVSDRLALAWGYVGSVWNYELVVSEDQPITISMVVWGIVLLVAGLKFSRWGSTALCERVLPRLGVHESAAGALKSISFYALVSLTALAALRWVNVPLTLFAFLGGALAIGIGFGSQNLVNNFISGLILLAERPIRTGDVIEIDGLIGSVDTIGARSTRIRTAANYEIIVPNSSLLEKNVVNWTLSDNRVRSTITVGLAYGSPTREVARWLKKAALEHGQVLDDPEPFVLFVGFGDNALEFELHYWIKMRMMSERRRIESDLRFMIDQYFREAGLVIAFPQRDLHLTSQEPLKVAVLPADALSAPAASARAA
jgi:small-conductance mechanosensitive channel